MVESLLKVAREHIDKATDAEKNLDLKNAILHYLQAAKLLFTAAQQSNGELKKIRTENAECLLKKANSLKISSIPEKTTSLTNPEQQKISDEDQSSTISTVPRRTKVSFNDVAGLENVKKEIRLKLIYPFEHPELAKRYGKKSGGGILLYGPPGTGKTMIAKAVAGEVDADFFSIKPSDLMDQYVGVTEKKIAELFQKARKCEKAVIFIDEIESLMPKRHGQSSTVMKRVVPQFLSELDGLDTDNQNILFLGATNEPWSLDPAALRPGRFDEKIYIPPPDQPARKKIFELNLKGRPLGEDIDIERLADATEGYSGADIAYICEKASSVPFQESVETGKIRNIMIADMHNAIKDTPPSLNSTLVSSFEDYFKDYREGFKK